MCTLVLVRNGRDDQKDRGLAQAGFGLPNWPNLCGSPQLHTDSNCDVLILVGELMKCTFQRMRPHIQITSDSPTRINFLWTVSAHRSCNT
jgi:hypothetical protein